MWSVQRLTGLVFMMCLALGACGGGDGGDAEIDVAGTYRGTVQDSVAGAGTAVYTLAQDGDELRGTGQTRFANPANNGAGSIEGTLSGDVATLTLTPSNPRNCPFHATVQFTGTLAEGTYAAFNCTVAVSGTVRLTRQ